MNKSVLCFFMVLLAISWPSYFVLSQVYNRATYLIIVALWFMPSPTYTILLLKLIRKEKIPLDLSLESVNVNYALLALALVVLYLLLTVGVVYLLGNVLHVEMFGIISFDNDLVAASVEKLGGSPLEKSYEWIYLFPLIILSGILAGCSVNMLFALTEEVAWRGFLLSEFSQYSVLKANLIIGMGWGLWHTPIILLGHNFYNYPLWGVGLMILFCISLSFLLYFLRVKSNSIWVPSAFHGSLNGTASGVLLFMHNGDMLFSNPVGVAGILAIVIIVIGIFIMNGLALSKLVGDDLHVPMRCS